jgi:cytochrome c peroxidase
MGFNDREMVCLCGAHALGRCHTNASGYDGPWTRAPETCACLSPLYIFVTDADYIWP